MGKLDADQYEHYARIQVGPPDGDDDSTQGFSLGNEWLDTDTKTVWKLVAEPSPGSAVWLPSASIATSSPGQAAPPGQLLYGTLLDYPFSGGYAKGEIQYVRLSLVSGLVTAGGTTFVDSGGSISRNIRIGLYDQTDPEDPTLGPNNRVVQTAQTVTTGGGFIEADWLGGDYTVPTRGFYWLAIVNDSTTLKFAVTASIRANFIPVARETPGSTADLPTTAGVTTNPVATLAYVSLNLA